MALRDSLPPGLGDVPSTSPVWATFVDDTLERTFRKEDFELNVRRFARFSVTLSVVAYLSYALHDALVIPEARAGAWLVRFAVCGPLLALVLALVFTNRSHTRHQPVMLLFGLTVNLGVIWIGALARATTQAGFFLYTSYAVVFVAIGPFLGRMNVKTQVAYTVSSIALYNVFDALVAKAPSMVLLSLNVALLTLGTIGALAAHQLELQARLTFLQRKIIREQMHALDVERTRSESLLLNILPRAIADRLKRNPGVIADRFETGTVLFSDIVGFTELSAKLAPDELVRRLDAVFTRFDEIADELRLEKIKTIGDAYMVAGGLPMPRDDHAEAVCEMALRMRDALTDLEKDIGGRLDVRIGVHTGAMVAGVIGKKKFIYDVWGDTVNTASRMESHGAPGKIQVSEATYEQTSTLFEFEPRGEITVKGKGTMKTWFLVGRRAIAEDRNAALPV